MKPEGHDSSIAIVYQHLLCMTKGTDAFLINTVKAQEINSTEYPGG